MEAGHYLLILVACLSRKFVPNFRGRTLGRPFAGVNAGCPQESISTPMRMVAIVSGAPTAK